MKTMNFEVLIDAGVDPSRVDRFHVAANRHVVVHLVEIGTGNTS